MPPPSFLNRGPVILLDFSKTRVREMRQKGNFITPPYFNPNTVCAYKLVKAHFPQERNMVTTQFPEPQICDQAHVIPFSLSIYLHHGKYVNTDVKSTKIQLFSLYKTHMEIIIFLVPTLLHLKAQQEWSKAKT